MDGTWERFIIDELNVIETWWYANVHDNPIYIFINSILESSFSGIISNVVATFICFIVPFIFLKIFSNKKKGKKKSKNKEASTVNKEYSLFDEENSQDVRTAGYIVFGILLILGIQSGNIWVFLLMVVFGWFMCTQSSLGAMFFGKHIPQQFLDGSYHKLRSFLLKEQIVQVSDFDKMEEMIGDRYEELSNLIDGKIVPIMQGFFVEVNSDDNIKRIIIDLYERKLLKPDIKIYGISWTTFKDMAAVFLTEQGFEFISSNGYLVHYRKDKINMYLLYSKAGLATIGLEIVYGDGEPVVEAFTGKYIEKGIIETSRKYFEKLKKYLEAYIQSKISKN